MKKGWVKKKLSDVCEKITDGTHQTPSYFDEGILFLSSKNVTTGRINWNDVKYIDHKQHIEMQKRVSPRLGDILLAKNGTTGVAAMVDRDIPFDIYVSLALLRPRDVIFRPLLLHFINSPVAKEQFNKRLKGVGVPNLHLEEIREVEIAFPSSLPEQKRIVAILDEAFEGIATAKANAQQNRANARALFESHLNAVFSQKGEGWVEKRLGDVADFKNGLNYSNSSKGQTLPVVGVGNFQENEIVPLSDLQLATIDGDIGEGYTLKKNDILTVRSNGSKALVGRSMLVPTITDVISFSGFIIRIRCNEAIVVPEFLLQFMKSPSTRARLTMDGGGANISNINQAKLSMLQIYLPSPELQKKIVKDIRDVRTEADQLESIYQRKIAALDELKKALLHKAFSGEL